MIRTRLKKLISRFFVAKIVIVLLKKELFVYEKISMCFLNVI